MTELGILRDFGDAPPRQVASHEVYWQHFDSFQKMFTEAATVETSPTIQRSGPHAQVFQAIMTETQTDLQELDPRLTANHLANKQYWSKDSRSAYTEIACGDIEYNGNLTSDLSLVGDKYRAALKSVGEAIGNNTAHHRSLNLGEVLDSPQYIRQGQHGMSRFHTQTCFAACFRMVYAGVTGEIVNEAALMNAAVEQFGTHLVNDNEYLGTLHTREFARVSGGQQVRTLTIQGADVSTIYKVAGAFKQKVPGSEVYCIVSLASQSREGVWHTNVLVGSDSENVFVHDPSAKIEYRGQNKPLSYAHFYERWGQAFNRVHFVVASPGEPS